MEKQTIYSSAPKPPKQIRVEENPEETAVEKQDLPEQKEEQPSKITVMHPTVSKDTVVKLSTEKKNEPINEAPELKETATVNFESTDEKLDEVSEHEAETISEQIADPEKNSTEEEIELGEIDTPEKEIASADASIETETTEIESPEKASTEEKIELEKIDDETNDDSVSEKKEDEVEIPDPEKESTEEQNELAEIDAKTNDEAPDDDAEIVSEEPSNVEFETKSDEVSSEIKPAENIEAVKITAETKAPTEKGTKSSRQKNEPEQDFENLKIPGDDELFQRQYYTMGEVATMFHANQSQIRFWENEFDILQPKKNKKGDRYFRPEDVKNLQVIHHLLRNRRFTIEGAREYLKSNKQRTQDTVAAITSLNQLKSFLTELKANL